MPNISKRDRRAVIMGWTTSRVALGAPMLNEAQQNKLEAMGRLTPTLRQLIGC